MYWYLVIGTVPGNVRTSTCYSRRWQAHSAMQAAKAFFADEPGHRRCLVTCVDTDIIGPQTTFVFDRADTPDVQVRT